MVLQHTSGLRAAERLRELYSYRELVWNLTVRDLRLKYKGSILGVAWSLLNPLLMMAIYTIVFSVFLKAFKNLPNYWALVIGGVLAWTFLANALNGAAVCFVRNPNLISKVYFPIESIPISIVLANLVNFVIPLAILVVVLVVRGIPVGASLVLLPVVVVANLALVTGLALALAALTVFFRDVEHLLALALQLGFYLTPVLFPLDPRAIGGAAWLIPYARLNPLAWYLDSYHAILYWGVWPDPGEFALMLAAAAVALLGGYLLFLRLRARLPEEV